jgi:hypothetical protein
MFRIVTLIIKLTLIFNLPKKIDTNQLFLN